MEDPAARGRYGPLRRPLALVTFPAAPRELSPAQAGGLSRSGLLPYDLR